MTTQQRMEAHSDNLNLVMALLRLQARALPSLGHRMPTSDQVMRLIYHAETEWPNDTSNELGGTLNQV